MQIYLNKFLKGHYFLDIQYHGSKIPVFNLVGMIPLLTVITVQRVRDMSNSISATTHWLRSTAACTCSMWLLMMQRPPTPGLLANQYMLGLRTQISKGRRCSLRDTSTGKGASIAWRNKRVKKNTLSQYEWNYIVFTYSSTGFIFISKPHPHFIKLGIRYP